MRELTLTQAARSARNAALAQRANQGPDAASVAIYSADPAAGGILLAARTLAQPGAVLTAQRRIQLLDGGADDLVLASGAACWAVWLAGDGAPLCEGMVTDAQGMQSDGAGGLIDTGDIGPWVLGGTQGTQLYAGGIVALAQTILG